MEKKKVLTPAQADAARRLKTLYEAKKKLLGITQQSIADELDITQGAVGHYLNGRNPLNPAVASVFARLLKVDVEAFSPVLAKELAGMGVVSVNDPTAPYRVNSAPGKKYPVLRTLPVTAWHEISEIYDARDVELWLDADIEILGEAFWLKMEGNSMTAPTGLSVPEGYFVLFDTGREPVNNSLVLATLPGASEVTFKKLIVDGGQMYLAGLNPQWPLVPIDDDCRLIGVALETRLRLLQT
ncbi:XRE family transcriptional regulator [Scandinavium sp.]|uniref:LexA family protein n=1 Tax=Scandinavium sp. TaxID=2830653 RepID=UPI00289D596E|nr:XRE family transcriptional regulator [Scandinavium sp.]